MKNWLSLKRRTLLKLTGIAATAGLTGGCDGVGSFFGRMFAVPARDTNYFTENKKFYVVNYSDSPFNVSRDLRQDEWRLSVKGEVKKPLSLGWRELLNRTNFEQVSTLMCIDTLPGGDSLGNARWRGISLKKLLQEAEVDEDTTRDIVFRGADAYDDSIRSRVKYVLVFRRLADPRESLDDPLDHVKDFFDRRLLFEVRRDNVQLAAFYELPAITLEPPDK